MNFAIHPVEPEEIMALLDGELSGAQIEIVSTHVEQCAECSQIAQQLRDASQSLSAWKVPVIPSSVEHSITQAATASNSEISKPDLFLRVSFWNWNWKQWAVRGGATFAVLVIVLAVSVPNLLRSKASARHMFIVQQEARERESRGSIGKLLQEPGASRYGASRQGTGAGVGSSMAGLVAGVAGGVRPGSPGGAADANSLFHGLGDRTLNLTDGQDPIDQQSKVFSSDSSAPMIARTVSLSIVVKDFPRARTSLDAILNRHHGYAAQLNVGTPENAPKNLVASLRIPAPELSSAIAELRALGRVENEGQSGEEVTEQHADLVARLKNSRDTEDRLRAILEQRTGKKSDVLQVEREIARVRGDIERMEAEQKALEHRVDFATVELQMTEEFKAELNPPAPSVSTRIHNALVAGYQNATETVLGIILFFAEDGPVLLLWLAILALPVVLVWRRYRRLAMSA
jgi:DNA-binding FrmR family transcriptional regulator